MKTQITLTYSELIEMVAKYLQNRVKLSCPCGSNEDFIHSRRDLEKHLRHIFQWGLDDE